jgi:hypothetical protein
MVRQPCRSAQAKVVVHYPQPHALLYFLQLLDEQARQVMKKRYPHATPKPLHTDYLALQLPRYDHTDLQWGDIEARGYQYVQVPAIRDCRNYAQPKDLAVGDNVSLTVVLSGWVHNKHQRRALCLRAESWQIP